MRSDRDKRTDSEREIDDFLSQFETPVDELSADINSYLETADTTKMTAARTFYGAKYREVISELAQPSPSSAAKTSDQSAPAVQDAAELKVADIKPAADKMAAADKKPAAKTVNTAAAAAGSAKNAPSGKKQPKKKPAKSKKASAAKSELKKAEAAVASGAKKVKKADKTKLKHELFF